MNEETGAGDTTLPDQVIVDPEIIYQELDDEMVLLNLKNENYYGLDAVGARCWKLLTENPAVSDAVSQLLSEFDVEEPVLRQDLARLFQELEEAGLVSRKTD